MRKFVLVSIAVATAIGSFATPSFAQRGERGNDGGSRGGRGEYFTGTVDREPVTHVRKRKLIALKSGAYCSTDWHELFDHRGRRTDVRRCDQRVHRDIQ